jgi:ABC-type Fe3+-siderophore transport system permease subunit
MERAPSTGDRRAAVGLVVGGGLVVAGALLPWLTLFAGLQHYPGTTGLYGWVVLAGGGAAVLSGLWGLRSSPAWLPWAGASLGLALFLFAVWLIAGLHQTMSQPAGPMLVPRAGPGLFVVLAGAGLLAAVPLLKYFSRGGRRGRQGLSREA